MRKVNLCLNFLVILIGFTDRIKWLMNMNGIQPARHNAIGIMPGDGRGKHVSIQSIHLSLHIYTRTKYNIVMYIIYVLCNVYIIHATAKQYIHI